MLWLYIELLDNLLDYLLIGSHVYFVRHVVNNSTTFTIDRRLFS